LRGRSVAIDPRTNAVRPDLADVRLADRVFAPHDAAPKPMVARRESPILSTPTADAQTLGILTAGEIFDVLEIATTTSWGQRRSDGLVGYVDSAALGAENEEMAA
jgi:hypothetical protein